MIWDGIERRKTVRKIDSLALEMHGNIKTLIAEFKSMNGKLVDTKKRFDKHDDESTHFRDKVNMLWAVMHSAKWVITIVLGSGALAVWIMKILEKQ